MSKNPVVQVRCDRCKRIELKPFTSAVKEPDLKVIFLDKTVIYEDLCPRCRDRVVVALKEMEEWIKPLKNTFIGPALSSNQAAPMEVAPDYSPPKPHSKK